MTTISPSRKKKTFSPPAVALLLCGVALLFFVALWRTQASNLFWFFMTPVVSVRNALEANTVATLRAELASTTAALTDRNALQQENLALKAQFGRDGRAQGILAGVLVRPPATPYDTLIIDAGKSEGILMGDAVSAGGTTRIGVVREVYEHTARVVLYSAPGESYQALLGGKVPISLVGEGAGSMSAEVPAGTTVPLGTSVVASGIASSFIGTVSHVEMHDGESFETIYVQLPVNLFSLRFVEVLSHTL